MKYTRELIQEAVSNSSSVAEIMRNLGLKQAGGTHAHITRKIKEFELNTSHFLKQGSNKGRIFGPRSNMLVLRNETQPRAKGQLLRKALLLLGVPDVCSKCGLGPYWNGKTLNLTPDHKNGRFWDNRQENLELLCPNCHSQSSTFCGRNKKGY